MSRNWSFARGEDIILQLEAVSGDATQVSEISADLKRAAAGRVPGAEIAIAASFAIEFAPAEGNDPAIWTLRVPGAVTATLEPGVYMTDARLVVNGVALHTEPVSATITPAVTVR